MVPDLFWSSDAATCSPMAMRATADGLGAVGLVAAGYRRLVAGECAAAEERDAVARFLGARGLTLVTSAPALASGVSVSGSSAELRTALSEAVMAVRPWLIQGGDPARLTAETLGVLVNRRVIALARDTRAARGGVVWTDRFSTVRSRAIGAKGLIVSLTNRRHESASVVVAAEKLGLSGVIRAVDAWSGRVYFARDGLLGGNVGARDTVLLEIV